MKFVSLFFAGVCLLLLCSCTTDDSVRGGRAAAAAVSQAPGHDGLPGDVTMNQEAGHGGWLFVTIRLASGEELPFVLDTGSSVTVFDQTLEPKLGNLLKRGTVLIFGVKHEAGFYEAPRLNLGDTPLLKTGDYIATLDCQHLGTFLGAHPMGILGADVLSHYCIQLDFAAGKIRFLDPAQAEKSAWGKPFPLTQMADGRFLSSENLTGATGLGSVVDTGFDMDGWLQPEYYQHWANHAQPAAVGEVRSPKGMLGGETYPDVDGLEVLDQKLISSGDPALKFNGIGLHTLSRNLVTLDFPAQTMYLKRTSIKPLPIDPALQAVLHKAGRSAVRFLFLLKTQGRLPGWTRWDVGGLTRTVYFSYHYPDRVSFDDIHRDGSSSVYHYQVTRASQDAPWRLDKAWRTDKNGLMLEEYSIH